ncbi:MAG: hypothetical protein K9K39_03240 [Desulfohalobiaceae bacterium]|nr:hypothetical protein [Desulfohalobiaceae bacterium]
MPEIIPKTFTIYVEEASVVCPKCWASIELDELQNQATGVRGTLQECPFCKELFQVDGEMRIEIA